MIYRIPLYIILISHQFVYQKGAFPKAVFNLICCLLAEYFYRVNKNIFKSIVFFLSLIFLVNTGIYYFLWYSGINLDYQLKLDIHFFNNEYLLSYQVYYLYATVHVNAFFQAYRKRFVPFYISFLASLLLFLFALTVNGRNPAEGYPHGFLDDAGFRSGLHLFAVVVFLRAYLTHSRQRLFGNPDPREFALLILYLIYNLMMIAENIFTVNNFSTYTYTYPFILLMAYLVLKAKQSIINFIFLDNRFKNSVIVASIILFFIEDFPAYKGMWLIIAASFFYFRYYTNRIPLH